MSYQDFNDYCNQRACDGRWSMTEAVFCIEIIERVQSIKKKGLFSKRRTYKARKEEFEKIKIEMENEDYGKFNKCSKNKDC